MTKSKDSRRRGPSRTPLTADLLRPARAPDEAIELLQRDALAVAMREREELHRLACEAGRTGSWYVPLDTRDCVLSPMAAGLLGLPAQELVLPLELWQRHIDPEHLARLESVARAGIEEDRPFDLEFRATRADGTEYWLHARGGVVRDSEGKPVRLHGALVDLTEHKNAKDELARLNATLEQRVAERTAELIEAQDALRQSQKLEAMGQLTGGLAHDFNNLLTPIIAALDRLQQSGSRGPGERRLIEVAAKSADSARLLIQRLLAFARRQPLQPTAVDAAALVEGMADLIARTLGPQIRVSLDLGDELDPALADSNQLEMAILNLCVNARDAMPGGGSLTIAADHAEMRREGGALAPGRYVRLAVSDTGTGMDESTRARAIEPFFSTKEVGEGTGLGLSMVHGLASQLGGALTLASTPGVGTTVELWLPVWTGEITGTEAEPAAPAAQVATGTALLVDDHALVRMTTAEMLAELGFQVVEAESAEEAVKLVGGGLRPQLIVADHLMPGMTGADLARLLRGHCPYSAFLLVSGYAGAEGAAPDLPYLTKPFRKAELEAAIASVTGAMMQPAANEAA